THIYSFDLSGIPVILMQEDLAIIHEGDTVGVVGSRQRDILFLQQLLTFLECLTMKIIAYMGSPRTKGLCAQFTESALKGATSAGAEVKQYNLVKYSIKYCRGCYKCVYNNHDLPIGICPLKDDMAAILKEYLDADGYIMASPVYDFTVPAVMKAFIERRFPMFFKTKGERGVPDARVKQHFKKKASLIATGSAGDEYAAIADPCFEVMSGHFMLEEIDTVDQLYVGLIHNVDEVRYKEKMDETFNMGVRLVQAINDSRKEE
ncbi:MAG: flavodoxin family protein, partial [Thermodesulfobacteriota bacterium]|nr:flavodoxin family protein [Thermodesulfobacteriota bacterium]